MSNLRLLTMTTKVKMALRWQGVIVLLHGILIVNCLPTETNPIDLNEYYRPQIWSILDQLNNNPNRIYNYNFGHFVDAEKKTNEVIDIKLDVDAECVNREICSSVLLTCRGYVEYFPQENKFQALPEIQCHIKSPPSYNEDVPQLDIIPPVEEEEIVPDKAFCLGCLMELDKNAAGMEPFLDLALQHIQSERDTKHLIVKVLNVQRQVVAGIRYIFVVEIAPTLCPKSIHIIHTAICPIDTLVQPEICRIEFFEKPSRNSNKDIISNNCTISKSFTTKETKLNNRNDFNNEIDMQGYKKTAKLHEFDRDEEHSDNSPNFDQIAETGNFDNVGLSPQRLAALEAQIIPFISVETTKAGSLDTQLGVEDIPSVQTSTDSFSHNDDQKHDIDDIMKLRERRQTTSDESKSSSEESQKQAPARITHELQQLSDESKSSEENKQPENSQIRQKREMQFKKSSVESASSSEEEKQLENTPATQEQQMIADISKSSSEETQDPKTETTKLKRSTQDSSLSSEEDINNNEDHAEKTDESVKEPKDNNDENYSSESEGKGKTNRKRRAADDNSSSSSSSNENDKGNDDKNENIKELKDDKNNKDDDSSSSSDDDNNKRKKRATNNGNNESSSSSSSSSDDDDDDNGNGNNGNDNNGNDDNNHNEKKHRKKAHSKDNKKKVGKKEDARDNNNDDSSSSSSSDDNDDNNNNRRKRNTDENKSKLNDLIKKIADFAADSFNDDEHKHKVLEILRVKKIELEGAVYHLSLRIGMSKCSEEGSCTFDTEKLCKVQMHVSKTQQMKVLKSHCHNMGSDFDKNRTTRRFSRQIPGGVNNINIDDKIKNLTSTTLLQLDGESQHENKYKIIEILEAKKQVIAGLLYKIKAKIILSDCLKTDSRDPQLCGELKETAPKICDIIVWEQLWLEPKRRTNVTCEAEQFYFRSRRDTTNQLLGKDDHRIHYGLFKNFMKKHNKNYNSNEEMLHRFRVFRENMKTAEFLNQNERGTATYGASKFADLTADEFKKYLGYRPDLRNENDIEYPKAKIPNVDLPKEFDWRRKGVVSEVKNQGGCGSCWAFSVTGNVEGQYAIKNGNLLEFSEQELVDCDTLDQGCGGGLMDNAYRVIEKLGGLEQEKDYPYDAQNEKCHFNQSLASVQLSGAVNISQDETDMAKWLVKNGPISIAINANAMQLYMGGVSHPWKFLCDPKTLDHGVLIVGYGVHSYKLFHKTLPYWIIKNSWGPSWGEQGYYRVYRGDGTCGVNQMASSAIVV